MQMFDVLDHCAPTHFPKDLFRGSLSWAKKVKSEHSR